MRMYLVCKYWTVFFVACFFISSCTKDKAKPLSDDTITKTPVSESVKVSWAKLPPINTSADAILNVGNNFYISTGNMLYRSFDSCTTWNWVANFGTLYFVENGSKLIAAGREFGVHVSTNNGINWTNQGSHGLSGQDIRGLVRTDTALYIGIYSGGVFFSKDDGLNWSEIPQGIPEFDVKSLLVKDTALLIGSTGIYRFNKKLPFGLTQVMEYPMDILQKA